MVRRETQHVLATKLSARALVQKSSGFNTAAGVLSQAYPQGAKTGQILECYVYPDYCRKSRGTWDLRQNCVTGCKGTITA